MGARYEMEGQGDKQVGETRAQTGRSQWPCQGLKPPCKRFLEIMPATAASSPFVNKVGKWE